MSEYVDFHYMPLEGKITGKQVLKQTEDAINDLGNKVYNLDVDEEHIDEAIEKSEQAINTANSALSAVTTDRAVWKNIVAEMKATDIELGVTAATRGKNLYNDGDGAFYVVRQEKSGDIDGEDTVFLDNGNVAERLKQFDFIAKGNNIIYVENIASLREADAVVGNVYGTTGYYYANDGGAGVYNIRPKESGDVEDGGSIIFLDNGNIAELITDGTVNIKQFGAYGDGVHDDTLAVQNAVDYNKVLYFPNGTYKITNSIIVNNGCNWNLGNKAILILESNDIIDCFIQVTNQYITHDYNSKISGGMFDGNFKCNTVLGYHGYRHLKVDHIAVKNFNIVGIDAIYNKAEHGNDCGEGIFNSILIKNDSYIADSCGLFSGHDNFFNNVVVQDTCIGFKCEGGSFENCHYWASIEAVFDDSVAFVITADSQINNAVVDTCRTGFKLLNSGTNAALSNITFIHNNIVIPQAHANAVGIYLFDLDTGVRLLVNNMLCLLYQGYTNVHKFTDRVIDYAAADYYISFTNDTYLAQSLLKNNITDNVTSAVKDFFAIKGSDPSMQYSFKVPKFRRTDYAHFLMFGGQSWKYNFLCLGVVDDSNAVTIFNIFNPDNIVFTGTYDFKELTISSSITLYGGLKLFWLN